MSTDVKLAVNRFLLVLKICGAYVETEKGKAWTTRTKIHFSYCIIVNMLVWMDTSRSILSVFSVKSVLSLKFMTVSICALLYSGLALYLSLSLRELTNHLPAVLENFENFRQRNGMRTDVVKLGKRAALFAFGLFAFNVLDQFGLAILFSLEIFPKTSIVLYSLQPFQNYPKEVSTPIYFFIALRLTFVIQFYCTFVALFIVLVKILDDEYCRLCKCIQDLLKLHIMEQHTSLQRLEPIRLQYEEVTELLEGANRILQHVTAMQYLISLPMSVMLLYGIIHGAMILQDLISVAMAIVSCFVALMYITAKAGNLSEHAHAPLDFLLRFDTTHLSLRTVHQIQIFISRLSGPPIGVKVYGLFTVEKNMILVLIGTLATYAAVVLPLAPDTYDNTGLNIGYCNCT